jgi:hypothetical protein
MALMIFKSIFLRYALPGLPDDFDGDIESKTFDNRITVALSKPVFRVPSQ